MFSLATRPNEIVLHCLTLLWRRQSGGTSGSRRGFFHGQLHGRFCDVVDLLVAIASRGQVVHENLVVKTWHVWNTYTQTGDIVADSQTYVH